MVAALPYTDTSPVSTRTNFNGHINRAGKFRIVKNDLAKAVVGRSNASSGNFIIAGKRDGLCIIAIY